jgi:hypothetical protein
VFTVTPSPSGTPLTETLSYTIGQFGSVSHTANVTIRASSITEQSQDPSAYLKQLQVNATSVYTGGWDAAEDKLVWPSYGTGLSTLIKYPDRGASASSTSGTSADQSAKMVLLTDDSTNSKVTCRIGGTVVAECPYSGGGGATVRNVKLLENIGGVLEEVVSPVTVNSSRTVFPRVTLSDNTTVDGSSYTFNPHSGGYVFGSETFTGNGTYRADSYGYDGFTSVTVAVPGAATLGAKEFTVQPGSTNTYYAYSYGLDGFSSVKVIAASASHDISMGAITESDSDPGSAYAYIWQNQIGRGKWYNFSVSCGNVTEYYKFFVRYS